MNLCDVIAEFILENLSENDECEIGRNELASKFNCAPSQITYVITTRFSPNQGYVVQSRRGGGGYIRIIRKVMSEDDLLMKFFNIAKEGLSERELESILETLYASDIITSREGRFIRAGLSQNALSSLPREIQNEVRGNGLCNIILSLIK